MNESRFMEKVAVYGADLSRWPEDDRAAAEAFLGGASHRIKDIWESERAFDQLLALDGDLPASIALEKRILAASPRPAASARRGGWFGRFSAPQLATGAIAASMALGLAVGYAAEPEALSPDYAQMLSLSDAGAGAVFLTAMNEPES